jgi:predicted ribonuclease YlaK
MSRPRKRIIDQMVDAVLEDAPVNEIPKKFTTHDLKAFKTMSENQGLFFKHWQDGYNVVADGVFGTGKTFLAMYAALTEVLDPDTPQDKIIIVRSVVSSREMGFLPGTEEEKLAPFKNPYVSICDELFKRTKQYHHMEKAGVIEFHSSSFVRGNTFSNAVILIDECQNFNYTEMISCLSRVGRDSRVIVCGDGIHQNDLQYKKSDKSGFDQVIPILHRMPSVRHVTFGIGDIVRSGFCKELAKSIAEKE